ncbi:hypothetical protein TELCIR_03558, partial [Teladorsagia circumcincta]
LSSNLFFSQIACQGSRCEYAHGDWLALTAHVDSYLRSPEDRFSVILNGELKLVDEMEPDFSGDMKKILSVAIDRAAAKEEEGMISDEAEVIDGSAHSFMPMRAELARFEYHVFDFPRLEDELSEFIGLYTLFNAQLSLKLTRDSAQVSLCSWFMAGEGVESVRDAAQIDGLDEDSSLPQFNEFLSTVVKASLQILSPKSPQALLARSLATHDKYLALMALRYLNDHRHSEEVIEMARSAISSLPPGHKCTDPEVKRMALSELIKRMLHANDWQSIVDLNYGKLEEEFQLPKEACGNDEIEAAQEITQEMIDVTLHDVIADELNIAAPPRPSTQHRMFILTAEALCEECVVASARVALLVTGEVPPSDPKEIVEKLIAIKNYDVAFDVCSNHWSVVRGLLAAAGRLWPNDSRPLRAITRTFLAHKIPVPCWLDAEYAERDVGGYLRCLIEYGAISQGLKVAANCVDQETKKVKSTDSRVWLPLTAISDLLNLGAKEKEEKLLSCLNEKLRTHFTRVEGFEKVAQLSH